MSHIASYDSSLEFVNESLFMAVLRDVAAACSGEVSASVDSYDEGRNVTRWQGHQIVASIRVPVNGLPQGLGIYFTKDRQGRVKPVFAVDELWKAETTCGLDRSHPNFWPLANASKAEIERLKKEIERRYVMMAYALVLGKRGYRVSAGSVSAGVPFVQGVRQK